MKKFLLSCVIASTALSLQANVITTTLVSDDFKRETLGDRYTVTENGSATINNNVLKITGLESADRTAVFGNTTMSGWLKKVDADSLVWMVNMRNNWENKSTILSGFDKDKKGVAVILAGTQASLENGSGYAIIYGGNDKQQFRLTRYTNGVKGQNRFTDIVAGTEWSNSNKNYFAFRVVYIPATNTWRLYDKDCGDKAFTDPSAITDWNFCGEQVDDTYTNQVLGHFFFLHNGTIKFNLEIDNFSLVAYNTSFVEKTEMVNENFKRTELGDDYVIASGAATIKNNQLSLECPKNDNNGRNAIFKANGITGWLKNVAADSLVWMGNMRHNWDVGTNKLSGFDAGKRGIAVILAGTKNDKIDAGSGYAVIYGGNSKQQIRLVSFTGGVDAQADFTEMIAGTDTNTVGNKYYFHFRVVYIPSTQTWKLYDYQTKDKFVDPATITNWSLKGEVENTAHTSNKKLEYYGFVQNYSGTKDFVMNVKHFTLTSYLTQVPLKDDEDNDLYLKAIKGQTVNVNLYRTLSSASYNTICLPFDMTGAQIDAAFGSDCEVVELSDASLQGDVFEMVFTKVLGADGIKAGKPYLIKPAADVTEPALIKNVTIDNTIRAVDKIYVWFTGVFFPKQLEAGNQDILFLGAGNTLYWPEAGGDNTMNGFRCYFKLKNGAEGAKAPRMVIRNTPTDMSNHVLNEQPVKVLENGQLVIQKGNVKFNMMGQQL